GIVVICGVGITAGIVVICSVGCAVAVEVAACTGEISFCTGLSTWFTFWVGRTSLSGVLVLDRKIAAYVTEATMMKQRSTNPKTLPLLCCVRLLTGLSLCWDRIISYFFSLPD